MQCLRQQIQDLRFKINAREILFGKIFEKPNLNNTTYNFIPKNAMKLRFNKSLGKPFLGQEICFANQASPAAFIFAVP